MAAVQQQENLKLPALATGRQPVVAHIGAAAAVAVAVELAQAIRFVSGTHSIQRPSQAFQSDQEDQAALGALVGRVVPAVRAFLDNQAPEVRMGGSQGSLVLLEFHAFLEFLCSHGDLWCRRQASQAFRAGPRSPADPVDLLALDLQFVLVDLEWVPHQEFHSCPECPAIQEFQVDHGTLEDRRDRGSNPA